MDAAPHKNLRAPSRAREAPTAAHSPAGHAPHAANSAAPQEFRAPPPAQRAQRIDPPVQEFARARSLRARLERLVGYDAPDHADGRWVPVWDYWQDGEYLVDWLTALACCDMGAALEMARETLWLVQEEAGYVEAGWPLGGALPMCDGHLALAESLRKAGETTDQALLRYYRGELIPRIEAEQVKAVPGWIARIRRALQPPVG